MKISIFLTGEEYPYFINKERILDIIDSVAELAKDNGVAQLTCLAIENQINWIEFKDRAKNE